MCEQDYPLSKRCAYGGGGGGGGKVQIIPGLAQLATNYNIMPSFRCHCGGGGGGGGGLATSVVYESHEKWGGGGQHL